MRMPDDFWCWRSCAEGGAVVRLIDHERIQAEVERKSRVSLRLMIRGADAVRNARLAKSFKYHGGTNS